MPAVPESHISPIANRAFRLAEDVLYLLIGLLLVAGALLVLIEAAVSLATNAVDEPHLAVEKALDSLLITFILVELLSAVRETLIKRQLVAEPFLLVGIIASIKEIVVIGAFAEDDAAAGEVTGTLLHLAVLGGVVLALSVALLLLRRKEREPEETAGRAPDPAAPPSGQPG
jgi:uncharacterized membrane protein (DUF373 family)